MIILPQSKGRSYGSARSKHHFWVPSVHRSFVAIRKIVRNSKVFLEVFAFQLLRNGYWKMKGRIQKKAGSHGSQLSGGVDIVCKTFSFELLNIS